MTRLIIGVLTLILVISVASAIKLGDWEELSGAHYDLTFVSMASTQTLDLGPTNDRTIFVGLKGESKLFLAEAVEADGLLVLDRNGDDSNGAAFQLPATDPKNTCKSTYSVYVRPPGRPNGKPKMTTAATDPGPDGTLGTADDELLYSVGVLELDRQKGCSQFQNVTEELLYVRAYISTECGADLLPYTDDDTYEFRRVSLFDDALKDCFWAYDDIGRKTAQLRFYPVSIAGPDASDIYP